MSAELDITIRYGLAGQDAVRQIEELESKEVITKIFEPEEDKLWLTGALARKAKFHLE